MHRARPAGRSVGGDHWETPDALWPANGQNQEGARELREAAVKRPHTRAAYAWAHIGSPGTAMGGARSLDGSCVYRPAPRPRGGSQPYFRALDGFGLRRWEVARAATRVDCLPLHPAGLWSSRRCALASQQEGVTGGDTKCCGRSEAGVPLPLTQVPALSLFEFLAQDLAHLARRDRGLGTVHILR